MKQPAESFKVDMETKVLSNILSLWKIILL